MGFIARPLLFAGAAGTALTALLPWVTVNGIALDLGVIGAQTSLGARTVNGTDTSLWPILLGAGAVVAVLAALNVARKLLLALGVLIVVAAGGLLYYVANAVEIEAGKGNAIEKLIAEAAITSSTGPGPPLLLASGAAIVIGALLAR
jgi:hypothetical protein